MESHGQAFHSLSNNLLYLFFTRLTRGGDRGNCYKFEKNFKGEYYDISMSVKDDYIKENGVYVDVAEYTFIY